MTDDRREPVAITSDSYRRTVEALKQDPIIQHMAQEMRDAYDRDPGYFTHESGSAQGWFMNACLDEYHVEDGKIPTHIGGPAEAVLALVKEHRGDAA